MKKNKMNLEDLKIKSFITASGKGSAVLGGEKATVQPCVTQFVCSWIETCPSFPPC